MTYILNIETATKWCSVAVSKNNEIVEFKEAFDDAYIHSEKLHSFIDEVLVASKIDYTDLSAVAVSAGPGSYTGLRIGVATAKGICAALEIPLISIDTLQSLVYGAIKKLEYVDDEILFYPMIDARRMEVFYGVYDNKLNSIEPLSTMIFDADLKILNKKFYFFGDGSEKGKNILEKEGGTIINDIYCSSINFTELSFSKYTANDFASLTDFEPDYGKEFIAGKAKKIF